MRGTTCFCFSITLCIMIGEICESLVKTKNSRNPVFEVLGLIFISHNATTERNEGIKNTLVVFILRNPLFFVVFLNFVVFFFSLKHVFHCFQAKNVVLFILLIKKNEYIKNLKNQKSNVFLQNKF